MKKIVFIFCLGVLFCSCGNDDEPSNRDLLNGRHWILKEVESGPFEYYDDSFVTSTFSLDRTYLFICHTKVDDWKWNVLIIVLICLAYSMARLRLVFSRMSERKGRNGFGFLQLFSQSSMT